jgi:protein-L-isoaspartate(D-aspartate) O-methyltransferase
MAEQVFSVERIEALLFQARERFHALGINNIRARHGDGYKGWPEHATFDGIIITAAPEQVPSALLDQLAVDAWLVAPVGAQGAQRLLCVNRSADGFEETELDEVSFVPMIQGLQ